MQPRTLHPHPTRARSTRSRPPVAHLRVNQLRNGGRWNYLGTYSLARKTSVTLTAEGPLSTCADAVAFDPVGANLGAISQVILDNGDPGTRQEGVWKTSSGLLPF